jgi:putative (di)nucleoside polyphosphate hydrolase
LLRPIGPEYELLLLKKPRKNDAWQLPQGGMEQGETMLEAALRELMEEAGVSVSRVLGESEREYCYDFPTSYRRFRPDDICGQKIHFVLALAEPGSHVRVDGKEIDAHVWIKPQDLHQFIDRKEYRELVEALYTEALEKLTV